MFGVLLLLPPFCPVAAARSCRSIVGIMGVPAAAAAEPFAAAVALPSAAAACCAAACAWFCRVQGGVCDNSIMNGEEAAAPSKHHS
jgi:hypothetical protein